MEKTKILLAEDRKDARKTISDLLVSEGYEVVTTEDSTQAWDVLQQFKDIKLIILDYALWPKNGKELMEDIRGSFMLNHHAKTPIMFLTAYPEDSDMVEMKKKGIIVLGKPLRHYQDLLSSVKELLDNTPPQ